jgi:hypothetical protein
MKKPKVRYVMVSDGYEAETSGAPMGRPKPGRKPRLKPKTEAACAWNA